MLHRRLTRRSCVVGGDCQEDMRLTKARRAGRNKGWIGSVAEANTRQVIFLPNDMTLSLLFQSALSRQVNVSSAKPSELLQGCAHAEPEPPSALTETLRGARNHDCHVATECKLTRGMPGIEG
jgi:hypothetical protein